MGNASVNVYAKVSLRSVRTKKALGIFGPGRTDSNNKKNNQSGFLGPAFRVKKFVPLRHFCLVKAKLDSLPRYYRVGPEKIIHGRCLSDVVAMLLAFSFLRLIRRFCHLARSLQRVIDDSACPA